jgi:hypothetical protein
MKKGSGKAKGSQFEREVCVALSKWVSYGVAEDLFWRSAMSGGRATVGSQRGKQLRRQAGDISAVSAEGCKLTDIFYIECRFYKSLDIEAFLLKSCGKLWAFWDETTIKAQVHSKQPMLIAKQNRLPTIVLTYPNQLPCNPLATFSNCEMALFDAMLLTKFNPKELGA